MLPLRFFDLVALDAAAAGFRSDTVFRIFWATLRSPGFNFVFTYRWQSAMFRRGGALKAVAIFLWSRSSKRSGSEISLSAQIDGGLFLPHPYGVVIGDCSIGRDVIIQQNVTIGVRQRGDGSLPTIADSSSIGAGAVILGNVSIGRGAVIGANAVVLSDVPDCAVAVGIPAKIRRTNVVSSTSMD